MNTIPPGAPVITEIIRGGDSVVLRTRTIHIEVLSGPSVGQSTVLPGPEISIGSGQGVDLLLLDGAVSRRHVTLRAGRDGLRVTDAGSRNGTTLDGVRVLDAFARQGSILGLGASTLRVAIGQDTVDLPLSARERFGGLLGRSIAIRRVFSILERVAQTDDAVLVEGETGTGKELVAAALHEESARSNGPFVVFDCSAVAGNLIESELFGHVRGAFTGAVGDRTGAFEAADGGTLFLDEIGELPLDLQPKLLRALEKLEVRRVGANAARRVDVRIVAATNKNLEQEAASGRFREDLMYRLAVVRVTLPPLRERLDDVELLARHFAEAYGKRAGRPVVLDDAALRALRSRAYPGNVRDLRNAVARTLTLGHPDATVPRPSMPPAEQRCRESIDLAVHLTWRRATGSWSSSSAPTCARRSASAAATRRRRRSEWA